MIEGSLVRNSLKALYQVVTFIPCLLLIQPRKTEKRPDMTDKLLPGTYVKNQHYLIKPSETNHAQQKTCKILHVTCKKTTSIILLALYMPGTFAPAHETMVLFDLILYVPSTIFQL